jgi:hypothetical protein
MYLIDKINAGDNLGKTIVYLLLPLFFLLIIFPAAFQSNQVFISEYHDSMAITMPELFCMENPFALWNNYWITGLPEYADPGSDRYYPLSYPIFLLTQDTFIINLILLINLYLAYLFFFKMSGLMTRNSELSMISSLFSAVLLSRVFIGHPHIVFALAWIPLLYYAFFKIIWHEEVSVKNIGIIAISLAMIFFTGAVYYLFYSCLILAVFFIYYLLTKKMINGESIAVFIAVIIGALITSVKSIPVVIVSNALNRLDIINPLGDGGSFENNLSSIIFGTPIDKVFGFYESSVFIGIIILLLAIFALIFGREDWTFPAFFAIVVAFIWADGGNTLVSFIHLLPGLTNFRVAGRVLGVLLPIIILFAIYGIELLHTKIKSGDPFTINPRQKRNIAFGVGILILVKILELPFQSDISPEAWLSIAFVAIFIGILYFNKATIRNVLIFFSVAFLINAYLIINNSSGFAPEVGIKSFVIMALVIGAIAYFNKKRMNIPTLKSHCLCIILIASLCIVLIGNISYLQISDPKLNESPAIPIIEKIKASNNDGHQIWVLETGWSLQHLDFTYWFIKNDIHPMKAYFSNFLKTSPSMTYTLGNVTYFTPDYIIDVAYLENGNQNLDEFTFKVNNISVYMPDHVLPNAFVVRNEQLIPAKIEKFTPDEVVLSGQFLQGDVVVLKTAFYPGWKINNHEASNVGNMVGDQLSSETSSVTFKFDPLDVKIGAILTSIGIILLLVLIIKRQKFETYLKGINKSVTCKKPHKGKKSDK